MGGFLLAEFAVGHEGAAGALEGPEVAGFVAVDQLEGAVLLGEGGEGVGGLVEVGGVGAAEGGELGVEGDGFEDEHAHAPPHASGHGVDQAALVFVGWLPGFVEVGGDLGVLLGGFAFDGGELGVKAVSLGVTGGDGFSFRGYGPFGFGSVGSGGCYLCVGAGCLLGGVVGMGQVFHRAVILVRAGVENEPWGRETARRKWQFCVLFVGVAGIFVPSKIVVMDEREP